MSLDPNDGRKPSIQVAEAIKRDIRAGVYRPEKAIPSTPDLASKYKVAKQTVTNAVKLLQEEGYLVTQVGKGTFVRTDFGEVRMEPTLGDLADAVESVRDEVRRIGETAQSTEATEVQQLREDVAKLKKDVALLQTQLIDLYGRTGNQYPHSSATSGKAEASRSRRAG